jgi:hypothetical protein
MESVTPLKRLVLNPPGVGVLVVARRERRRTRIDTLADCQIELSDIYRQARRGRLPSYVATRLAFIVSTAAKLARDLAEMKEVEAIRAQLERIGATPAPPFDIPAPSGEGEVLPP